MTSLILQDYCPATDETASANCEGKFLQLVLEGSAYLVFSPASLDRYHNQMLARFLKDQGVAHQWVTPEQLTFDSAKLQVMGGGRFRVDSKAETLELWDNSHVFGPFDPRGLAESIASARHAWSGYAVKIS